MTNQNHSPSPYDAIDAAEAKLEKQRQDFEYFCRNAWDWSHNNFTRSAITTRYLNDATHQAWVTWYTATTKANKDSAEEIAKLRGVYTLACDLLRSKGSSASDASEHLMALDAAVRDVLRLDGH